jgi:hypothetical protein
MKIVDKEEFKNLPKNTLYCHVHVKDGVNVGLGNLRIKLTGTEGQHSEEMELFPHKINWAYKDVLPFPLADDGCRAHAKEGYFHKDFSDDKFYVLEEIDLLNMKEAIDLEDVLDGILGGSK